MVIQTATLTSTTYRHYTNFLRHNINITVNGNHNTYQSFSLVVVLSSVEPLLAVLSGLGELKRLDVGVPYVVLPCVDKQWAEIELVCYNGNMEIQLEYYWNMSHIYTSQQSI